MNAGKSAHLLQSSFNYKERGMNTLLFNSAKDDRFGHGVIGSRIGIKESCLLFDSKTNFINELESELKLRDINCILVDEAQFLNGDQVKQLADIVDFSDIPVLTYGIRTDFQGNLFEGSKYLLGLADNLKELKGVCGCGKKATMVVRVMPDGKVVTSGSQIEIGDNSRYISVCRKHHTESLFSGKIIDK